MLYPIISGILATKTQTVAISNYQETVKNISDEEKNKMIEDAEAYNKELASVVTSEKKDSRSYADYLSAGEIMGYVSVPKVNIYLPIYHGTSNKALDAGIGHMEKTSLPVGGESTHAVLAGHTGLSRAKMFDNIRDLEKGDKFYIYVLDKKLTYEVDQIKTVNPSDDSDLQIIPDEDHVTLLTCTPYILNTYRLLVRGTRIADVEETIKTEDIENEKEQGQEEIQEEAQEEIAQDVSIIENPSRYLTRADFIFIIAIAIIILITIIILIIKRKRKIKKFKKIISSDK